MPAIAVIGAGLIGATVAFHLAERGAEVIVLDQAEPGHAATLASFAWLNANNKPPFAYHTLNATSMREYPALAAKLAPADWYHPDGNLVWSHEPENSAILQARIDRLHEWGYDAELLSSQTVIATMDQGLAGGRAAEVVDIGWFPGEGWIDPIPLTNALLDGARTNGATIRAGADNAVIAINRSAGRVASVTVLTGETIPVSAVVNCAGIAAPLIAGLVDRVLPMSSGPAGFLVAEMPDGSSPLVHSFDADGFELRPDGPGRVRMAFDYDPFPELAGAPIIFLPHEHPLIREGLRLAASYVPALAEAEPVLGGVAMRPIPGDGYSCAGAVSGIPGYFECVTHSGATLCPLLGRLIADEILGGEPDPLLASFRPDRFAAAVAVSAD